MRVTMNVEEAASYLRLCDDTIERWARDGRIPAQQDSVTLAWRFDRDEIDDFIESCRIVPGTLVSGKTWPKGVGP